MKVWMSAPAGRVVAGAAVAVAVSAWMASALAQGAAAPAAAAASQPAGPTVSAAIAPALQAARQALEAKQFDEALKQLLAAEAVAERSAYENYLIARMRIIALRQTNDTAGAMRAIETALATGQAEPDVRLALLEEAAVTAALKQKDQPAAERWAQQYFEAGGRSTDVRLVLAQALYLQGKHPEAARTLQTLADQQRAAGQAPREVQLRLQAGNFDKLGDEAGYLRSLEQLIRVSPKPEFWAAMVQRLAARPGLDDPTRIEVLRLGVAADVFKEPGAWVELAERLLQDGFAIEAQKVVDAGSAAGVLGAAQAGLRQRAQRQADTDRRTSGTAPDAKAAAAMSAQGLFNTGWNLVTAGQREVGLGLMQQAIGRGIARQPDLARLRLGAAYAEAGDAAKAREWLQPLAAAEGADAAKAVPTLARWWLLRAGG